MRLVILLAIIIFFPAGSFAQYTIRASMGIDFANTPSLNDYINQSQLTGGVQLNEFNAAIVFSGEVDYLESNNFAVGLEGSYLLNSYNYLTDGGKFEIGYRIFAPSILSYYVLTGKGYDFKFGGGFGLRIVNVSLSLPGIPLIINYSNLGYGLILRAEGNTLLGGNFYANIGADLKYDVNGEPKNGNPQFDAKLKGTNLNSLAVGLHLGISYIF